VPAGLLIPVQAVHFLQLSEIIWGEINIGGFIATKDVEV